MKESKGLKPEFIYDRTAGKLLAIQLYSSQASPTAFPQDNA
ncbi:MAG: hypothetical protein WCJ94_05970 [bacterium]